MENSALTTSIPLGSKIGTVKPWPRIGLLDTARGTALIAMAIYHFGWDLEFFGYMAPGSTAVGGWKLFARLIAGSFLFLAGASLVLGHGQRLRTRPFLIRLAKITAAAAAISVATWFAFPDNFIFFGILHCLAAASVVGLLFLRLPVAVTFLAAVLAFAAPHYLRSPLFDTPALWWVGLSQTLPRSNDYVPLLPWLGPFLLGLGLTKLASGNGWLAVLAGVSTNSRWKAWLAVAGRHSLAIYLLHQPLLIALVYAASLIFPAARPDPVEAYRNTCVAACTPGEDGDFCRAFCDCTLDRLLEQDLFNALNSGSIDVNTDERIKRIAAQCSAEPGVLR